MPEHYDDSAMLTVASILLSGLTCTVPAFTILAFTVLAFTISAFTILVFDPAIDARLFLKKIL